MATFVRVQFDEGAGSGIALVAKSWLTPGKRQVFWPPYKNHTQYNRALKSDEIPQVAHTWQLYSYRKCYFECGKLLTNLLHL